ncbi:MAG: hypothetical protein KDC18_19400 [Alphaproteobacteria bacterium]|nr:hypothetical protein [Alphaproteobacteria bacterium]MCB9930161.1 hypothetical protein [Alphaproteobacteria bacterium]
MRWQTTALRLLLLGLLLPTAAAGADDRAALRAPLLRGDFQAAAQPRPADAAALPPALADEADYYRGLAAFALQDYPTAIATLGPVAEKHGAQPLGLRAAVVATLALSRNGDRDNACRYAGIVLPLTDKMAPIWRVWVEEAKRSSGCE